MHNTAMAKDWNAKLEISIFILLVPDISIPDIIMMDKNNCDKTIPP
jgi:hypothetical protein